MIRKSSAAFVAGLMLGQHWSSNQDIRTIAANTKELLAIAQAPEMPPLQVAKWQGRNIKFVSYPLNPNTDLQHLAETGLPYKWQPSPEGDPESTMPYRWPDEWAKDRQQRFYAGTVFYNLVGFANRIRKGSRAEDFQPYLDLLLTRTREFLTPADNGGGLVTYRFTYKWLDQTFESGWVSSLGNASIIAASVYYYRQTSDARFMQLAKELVDGLKTLDGKDQKWLSHIDPAQFLWFEEYPISGKKKTHVINGHISTTFALADYCRLTNDADACLMTRAGLATVRRYINSYRVPGQINRYSLYSNEVLDYGPTRSIEQQRALFELTGDRFFETMSNAFASDMAYDPQH